MLLIPTLPTTPAPIFVRNTNTLPGETFYLCYHCHSLLEITYDTITYISMFENVMQYESHWTSTEDEATTTQKSVIIDHPR